GPVDRAVLPGRQGARPARPLQRRGRTARLAHPSAGAAAAPAFRESPPAWLSSLTNERLILPRGAISVISTCSLSPTLTTSSVLATRLPEPSLLMCTRPSLPGSSETNAPNGAVFTTVPRYRSPTWGSCGLAMALIRSTAACADGPSA